MTPTTLPSPSLPALDLRWRPTRHLRQASLATAWLRRRLRHRLVCVRVAEAELLGVIDDVGPHWIALIEARHFGTLFEGDQVVTSTPFSILLPTAAIRLLQVLSSPPCAAGSGSATPDATVGGAHAHIPAADA